MAAAANVFAFVVAFVSNRFDLVAGHRVSRFVRHHRKGIAVIAVVRHLVRNDQVVLGFDGTLHVVTDHTGLLACRCHGTAVRISQRHLRFTGVLHALLDGAECAGFFAIVSKLLDNP